MIGGRSLCVMIPCMENTSSSDSDALAQVVANLKILEWSADVTWTPSNWNKIEKTIKMLWFLCDMPWRSWWVVIHEVHVLEVQTFQGQPLIIYVSVWSRQGWSVIGTSFVIFIMVVHFAFGRWLEYRIYQVGYLYYMLAVSWHHISHVMVSSISGTWLK